MKNKLTILFSILVLGGWILMLDSPVAAQGRGRVNGAGGAGIGAGNRSINRPGDPKVDFGLGRASQRSNGRSDEGLTNAGQRSNGRSDDGLDRARRAGQNALQADRELQQNPNISGLLGISANDLRERYLAALAGNPNLKFGQFVAANILAQKLCARFPAVTSEALLNGLAAGESLGRTLQNLGVSSSEIKDAERQARKMINESKKGKTL